MVGISFSHAILFFFFFLSVDVFSSLKETTDFLLFPSFIFNSTPVSLSSFFLFFHSFIMLRTFSLSAPLLFQWASNWGSVIGKREAPGREMKGFRRRGKKGKPIMKSMI